ncbi:LPS-assembly protein LptD, partial [Salmonella enterica subsp. enterica serovar Neukoelln]|nr:LPS-assembly protein LptD [Salmonella enterica subsp. enterica serovar Neukoelln]
MKKSYPTLLATIIWAALYSQAAQAATLAEQCMLGVPVYDEPVVDGKPGDFPVNITAQGVSGEYPHAVKYDGGVDIRSGNQNLKADEVEVTQSGEETNPVRIATATGDVRYSDPQIRLKGPKAWLNLNNNDADVEKGDYQMVGRQGRGDADKMKLRGE